MVIQVKGGKNVSVKDLRDLRGVLEADEALMAGSIVMRALGVRQHLRQTDGGSWNVRRNWNQVSKNADAHGRGNLR